MLFKPEFIPLLKSGRKTQTRRLVKEGERLRDGGTVSREWVYRLGGITGHGSWVSYRPRFQVGRDYAVQPGRGKKSVGRIRVTSIRREALQDISAEDVEREGINVVRHLPLVHSGVGIDDLILNVARMLFNDLWNVIYTRAGERYDDNRDVWVLGLEWVK